MLDIINIIFEKLKIKEILGIILIASLAITFLPQSIVSTLKLVEFRTKYQINISMLMIISGSYYLYKIAKYIIMFILKRFVSNEKIAIRYMKNHMSPDEMALIIQTFYNFQENRFKSSGIINLMDGRKTPLESKHIIYLSSQIGDDMGFSYNLQPYALEFLNKKLIDGKIIINETNVKWQF